METIGTRIKELRELNNISKKELGLLIFQKETTISKWENNNLIPDIDSVQQLANFFKLSISEMVKDCSLEKSNKKQKNEKLSWEWNKVNYSGNVDVKITNKWKKISIFFNILLSVLSLAFAGFLIWHLLGENSSAEINNIASYICIAYFALMLTLTGIFRLAFYKYGKESNSVKFNVTLKLYETFLEISNPKTGNIKIINAKDVKRINYNKEKLYKNLNYLIITIDLHSGKNISIFEVDESVLSMIREVV